MSGVSYQVNFTLPASVDNQFAIPHTGKHGSSSGGKTMEARVAKLESDVENIKNSIKDIKDDVREIKRDARTDFRLLFGALIVATLGLASLMAKGFNWI